MMDMGFKKEKNFDTIPVRPSAKRKFKNFAKSRNKTMTGLFEEFVENMFFLDKLPPQRPRMRKRGNVILESIFVTICLVCFILGIIILAPVHEKIENIVKEDPSLSEEAKQLTYDRTEHYEIEMDNVVLMFFGFFWLAVIGTSFLVESHPFFFILSIVLLCGMLLAIAMVGNAVEKTINEGYADQIDAFPKTYFIATHLVEFIIIIAFSVGITLYSKQRFTGG